MKWQLEQQKKGRCVKCARKAVDAQHCEYHRILKNMVNRAWRKRAKQAKLTAKKGAA